MPNINPRQMQQMMRRMGIQQQDVDAEEVIIKCSDKIIRIINPSVQKVNMMGQKTYQVSGEEKIEQFKENKNVLSEISDEDIQTVMEQTNCSKEAAIDILKQTNGDIAQAILLIKEKQ